MNPNLDKDWNSTNRDIRNSYAKNNKSKFAYQSAKRRAQKLLATPKWADVGKIKEMYDNRPDGYEVDHIIPLLGKDVCGLHVEANLQYLTVAENRSKSNRVING